MVIILEFHFRHVLSIFGETEIHEHNSINFIEIAMNGIYESFSTITLKVGKVLILKHNVEIMIPKAERQNILNLAHRTHLGKHMMVKQLRG